MASTGKVRNIQLVGHRRAFGQLRSADERSVVAAWRYGQVVDVLHKQGFTYEELGEDVDRTAATVKLYKRLYDKYEDEKTLLEVARSMKTYNVSRLAGHSDLIPAQYVFSCTNCGSSEVRRTKKHTEETSKDTPKIAPVHFQSAG